MFRGGGGGGGAALVGDHMSIWLLLAAQVWEIKTRKLLMDLPGHADEVCVHVI